MAGTTETITRTVESTKSTKISRAVFKGFNLTFTEDRVNGQLKTLRVDGYKSIEGGNGISSNVIFEFGNQTAPTPSIKFTPSSSVDQELADAINAEFELMKAATE